MIATAASLHIERLEFFYARERTISISHETPMMPIGRESEVISVCEAEEKNA
jgi:hypothetical protein